MHSIRAIRTALTAVAAAAVSLSLTANAVAGPRIAPSRGDRGAVDTVVAYFDHIAPEYRAEFQAAAQKEAYLALRTEPGTLSYHIVPDPADPSRFIFEATFRNAAAYAYHRGHYPAQDFLKLVARDGISGPHIVVDNSAVPNTDGVRVASSRGDRGAVDTVVAYFDHIAPEYRAEFQAAAQKEAYLALRTEPGTLGYHIVPDPADPSRFIFEATFRNAAAYAYHRGHYPAQDFLKLVARDGISGPHIVVDNTSVPNELG